MRFTEQNHSYRNDKGEMYQSVTSLIKSFAKPFDRIKQATKYAKKNKLKVDEVLAKWDKAGKDASEKGTAFHAIKESELLSKKGIIIDGENHPIYPPHWEGGEKISGSLKLEPGIYPEQLIWSDKYKLAGQADRVEVTKKNKINIIDYKTSKEIKQRGYEKWDGTVEKMKFPLQHLDDCNYTHYALQLNVYAFMIKQHNRNLDIGKMEIEHIKGEYEDGVFNIDEVIVYTVPNLQKEVKILLEYWKTINNK